MDFTPGLRLARRWWPLVLIVTLLAGALAYAASFLMTPTYSSSTRVLVRARDARFLSSTAEDIGNRPGVIDVVPPKSLNQTLAGMATSRAVAEQVVRELRLDQPRQADTSLWAQAKATIKNWSRAALAYVKYGFYAEPAPFDGAVEQLRNNVVATPIKDSYLMEIRVRADDPALATAAAEAVTRAFVRQSIEEFRTNAANYRAVLVEEVERARREVEAAETALRQYKEQHGITDIAEATRLSATQEDALRQQLRDVEAELTGARARHAALERTLASLSPTERSTTTATGQNTTSNTTTAEAGRAATTMQNDTTTGTRESRDTVAPNRVYQDVQREAVTLAAQIAGLESKRATLAEALADRARISGELATHAAQLSALDLQRSSAHSTYSAIRATYETAVVNDARGAEEVAQVDAATRPLYPDRPLRAMFLLLGLFCGLAGGAGLALVFDRWSPSWSVSVRGARAPAPAAGAAAVWPDPLPGEPDGAVPTLPAAPARPARYEV